MGSHEQHEIKEDTRTKGTSQTSKPLDLLRMKKQREKYQKANDDIAIFMRYNKESDNSDLAEQNPKQEAKRETKQEKIKAFIDNTITYLKKDEGSGDEQDNHKKSTEDTEKLITSLRNAQSAKDHIETLGEVQSYFDKKIKLVDNKLKDAHIAHLQSIIDEHGEQDNFKKIMNDIKENKNDDKQYMYLATVLQSEFKKIAKLRELQAKNAAEPKKMQSLSEFTENARTKEQRIEERIDKRLKRMNDHKPKDYKFIVFKSLVSEKLSQVDKGLRHNKYTHRPYDYTKQGKKLTTSLARKALKYYKDSQTVRRIVRGGAGVAIGAIVGAGPGGMIAGAVIGVASPEIGRYSKRIYRSLIGMQRQNTRPLPQ